MSYPSFFDPTTFETLMGRLEKLQPDTQPQWGKMNAAQMLAHLNVGYDIVDGTLPVKYNPVMRFMLKMFLKPTVTGNKSYKKDSRTAPQFLIEDERDFEKEKSKLLAQMKKTHERGAAFFEGRKSEAFGKLTTQEWSNQFYKHMDHHFRQFDL